MNKTNKKRKLIFGAIDRKLTNVGKTSGHGKKKIIYDLDKIRQTIKKYQKELAAKIKPPKDLKHKPKKVKKIIRSSKKFQIYYKDRSKSFVHCTTYKKKMRTEYILKNKEKLKYCLKAKEEFDQLKISQFLRYIPTLKTQLDSILQLKKTFYCYLCDSNRQMFFDIKNKTIIFHQQFCKDMLIQYKPFIYWNNVIFIEYLEQVLQMVSCFGESGDVFEFPFQTELTMYKQRIFFIKRCYENLDKEEFYLNCRFACIQYDMRKYSDFFEGHMDLFRNILVKVLDFLKQFTKINNITLKGIKQYKILNDLQKVDLILKQIQHDKSAQMTEKALDSLVQKSELNSLLKVHQNLIKKAQLKKVVDYSRISNFSLQEEIKDMEIIEPKEIPDANKDKELDEEDRFRENKITPEFYMKVKNPVNFEEFISFFTENQRGLNPLKVIDYVNFNYNATDLLYQQLQKTTPEKVANTVIQHYLTITQKNINDFHSDIQVQFEKLQKSEKGKEIIQKMITKKNLKKKKKQKKQSKKQTSKKTKTKKSEIEKEKDPFDWLRPYLNEKENRDHTEQALHLILHILPDFQIILILIIFIINLFIKKYK